MHRHLFSRCLIVAIMSCLVSLMAGAALAGQVVTDEQRNWARDAIAREKTLDTRPAPNTVAILYFDNQTRRSELDPLQKGFSLMLITDLAKIDTIEVVERARLQALVDELHLSTSGLEDPASAPRVGHLLRAAYLVGGRLLTAGNAGIRIDSDLLRVERQTSVGHPSSTGPFDDLLRMEKDILFEIVRLMGLELSQAQIDELRKPLTANMKALMLLFQGIGFSDRHDYNQAAASYEEALRLDPKFKPAAAAFEELRNLKLIVRPPATGALLQRLHKRVSVNTGPVPNQLVKRDRSSSVSVQGPATQTTEVNVRWH